MEVFRLTRKKYPELLSGKGAAICGGRWNSRGYEAIYVANSRALAMAEVSVHLSLATLPADYLMLAIDIPAEIEIEILDEKKLQKDWNVFPHSFSTQVIGDEFLRNNKYCVLKVPSAVVKGDFNYIINPSHPDFEKIKVITKEDFPFDKRIFH